MPEAFERIFSFERRPFGQKKPSILIWGESLVGSGHHRIMYQLAIALSDLGFQPVIATGSADKAVTFDSGDAIIEPLPPLHRIGQSLTFQTPSGKSPEDDPGWKIRRLGRLMQLYDKYEPAAIVTEMWPQERGKFFDLELLGLLRYAKSLPLPPVCFGLVRDRTFHPNGEDAAGGNFSKAAEIARCHLDGVIVRGSKDAPLDPRFADSIDDIVHYPGYFVSELPTRSRFYGERNRPVIVTSGGGDSPCRRLLYQQALAAFPHSKLRDHPWYFLVPHSDSMDDFVTDLTEKAARVSQNIIVERNRPDFHNLLVNAEVVISKAGFNTLFEVIKAKVPAIFLPIEDTGEQSERLRQWENEGLYVTYSHSKARSPKAFAKAIDETSQLFANVHPGTPDCLDGAHGAAELIAERLRFLRNQVQENNRFSYTQRHG